MKLLRKINLGFLLTIIVVIAVSVYCVNIELTRKKEKEPIKKSAEAFLQVIDKYLVLPKEYQKADVKLSDVNLDSYYEDLKKDLKTVMHRDQAIDIQYGIMKDILSEQLVNTSNIRVSYNRRIMKIKKYAFDSNQVTITFSSKITIKSKYLDENFETGEKVEREKEHSFDVSNEEMTLEKVNNEWKIVYVNLQYEDMNMSNEMQTMF